MESTRRWSRNRVSFAIVCNQIARRREQAQPFSDFDVQSDRSPDTQKVWIPAESLTPDGVLGSALGDSKCASYAISRYSVSCYSRLRLIPMPRSRLELGSVARCTGLTATATLLLSAPMATTVIIPMLALPTDTTDRLGSTVASLSAPAPGIAATDMDTAACTAIAAATAMGPDALVMAMAMAMDGLVTDMHTLVMVAATAVTRAVASMVAAVAVDSTVAAVAVDSTAVAVATVADTGNSSGVDQNEAAAGFHSCSRFFLSGK